MLKVMTICCLASVGVCGSELNGVDYDVRPCRISEEIRQVTPTLRRRHRAAQQLLDQWLAVGRKTGIKDKATIMIAVENLVAYLLCQYSDPLVAEERIDSFADNVREIVNSYYLEK
jgi:hypothetical protein